MEFDEDKAYFWFGVVFVIMSIFYVRSELIFNAFLLDVAGSGTVSFDSLQRIEVFGRALSGVGVSLLLLGLFRARLLINWLSLFGLGLAIVLVSWNVTYFGQRIIVDRIFIDSASPDTLQTAATVTIFRQALSEQSVILEELNYDPDDTTPATKAFTSLMPSLLLLGRAENGGFLHENMAQIIDRQVHNSFADIQAAMLSEHQSVFENLSNLYSESYLRGSRAFNEAISQAPSVSEQMYSDIEDQVIEMWGGYVDAYNVLIEQSKKLAAEHSPDLIRYFSEFNRRCVRRNNTIIQRCSRQLNSRYSDSLQRAGLPYVRPEYWLPSDATRSSGGYRYTESLSHYEYRFFTLPAFQNDFESSTGYLPEITNFDDFRLNDRTGEILKRQLNAEGVQLPQGWTLSQELVLKEALTSWVREKARSDWNKSMGDAGLIITPNLTWSEFEAHPAVQNKLLNTLDNLYVPGYRPSWSDAEFSAAVIQPMLESARSQLTSQWSGPEAGYEHGGKFYELGRQSLRATIIPPIAMFFSLLLINVNLLKPLVKGIVGLLREYTQLELTEVKSYSLVYGVIFIVFVILIPLTMVTNPLAKNANPVTQRLMKEVRHNSGFISTQALNWVLHAQPILYPFGAAFKGDRTVTEYTKNFAPFLIRLDELVLRRDKAVEQENKPEPTMGYLNVKTSPENARVRIMNIVPVYKPGIELEPGNYDIEVTSPGYQTYRRWHAVGPQNNVISITLEPELH